MANSKKGKLSERVKEMMKNYISLHEKGLSVSEIAERFGISEKTVYMRLGEIAEQNGLSREELLVRPRFKESERKRLREDKRIRAKFDQVSSELNEAITSMNKIVAEIDYIIDNANND